LQDSPEIHVNGVRQRVRAVPGTFATIDRTWKSGDRVEMRLPQSFRAEAIDSMHPKTVALMRGPVMYAALDAAGAGAQQPAVMPFYKVRSETYTVYHQQARHERPDSGSLLD
jgi:hypothetical protein